MIVELIENNEGARIKKRIGKTEGGVTFHLYHEKECKFGI